MNNLKSIWIKLFILTAIAALFLASQFTSPSAGEKGALNTTTNPVPDSQFIIGAFQNGTDRYYYYQGEMRFNTWHHYTADSGWSWVGITNDYYNGDTNVYGPQIREKIDTNYGKGMRTLMDRPIIEYLVGGQRIDYQCEYIAPNFQANPYWYYAYDSSVNNNTTIYDTIDNSIYGNGEKVKKCKRTEQTALNGFVLIDSGLRANREMSFNDVNSWLSDTAYNWFVLPRIRIDSAYAADGNNFDDTVCKIVVTGWEGNIEEEFGLRVSSFKPTLNSSYNGNYMESFYDAFQNLNYLTIDKSKLKNFTDTTKFVFEWSDTCLCDIKVYWSGKCDMWIDRVRIENLPAHEYLTLKDQIHDKWVSKVNSEVGWAGRKYDGQKPIPNYIYFEECQMSHFPVIKELNRQIDSVTGGKNALVIWLNYDLFKAHVPDCWDYQFDAEMLKQYIYTDYGLRNIVMGSYALEGWETQDIENNHYISYHPNTLLTTDYKKALGILSHPKSPSEYDTWLQNRFDDPAHPSGVNYTYISKLIFSLSKETDMRIINCPQAHLWYAEGHKLKEPSNEELELQANLALTNNAKGLIWFSYVGDNNTFNSAVYNKGIMNYGTPPTVRDSNVYEQNKYFKVCQIDSMLAKRGPYMISFDPLLTKNCIYRLNSEREEFLANTFIGDVITYKTSSITPDCTEDNPGGTNPQGLVFECKPDRYLQAATFKKSTSDINKYFMVVNRRCSPYIDSTTEDKRGGKRFVRVRFDANSSEFANFNNWKIIDIDSNKTVTVFDKRATALLDLGWYNPGQGKLYKIAPVMQEGGTFVCNEYVSASAGSFDCKDIVTNNGYELEIEKGVTINFTDTAKIEFSHSRFKSGVSGSGNNVILKGTGSGQWSGLNLSECELVDVEYTTFQDIMYSESPNSQNTAINLNNCANCYIANSTFYLTTPSSGIYALYTEISEEESEEICNIIAYNTFDLDCEYSPTPINVIAVSSSEIPLLLQSNYIENKQKTGGVGISISNITGGAIKSCEINDFSTGINSMSSALDISGNTIISELNNSIGIQESAESSLNLGMVNNISTGGDNIFSNTGTEVNNILTDYSTFNINEGYNTFNVYQSSSNCHLRGVFPGSGYYQIDALYNCFQVDESNTNQIDTVIWSETSYPVEFLFKPYSCELQNRENFIVLQTSEEFDYRDTIYRKSTGGSGGYPNPEELQTSNYRTLRDSININLRKRNYTELEDECKRLLLYYPDSTEAIGAVAKLYLSAKELDSLGDRIGPLKTFFETLILNNQGKTALINRAFYFIQKCKSSLKQYTSALQGFELIINQNPYTYEGLIASWDYASTQLLDSLNGGSGGMLSSNKDENKTELTNLLTECYENDINKDTIKLTKSDRKIIIQNTERAFEDTKTNETKKYDDVKKRSERGDEKARVEYRKMKTFNETNKIKQPRTTIELSTIIQKDFRKVFVKTEKPQKQEIIIPTKYELYQNYPNPFNPTTKIAFDLPKDAKVKLVIYDILGREMKTLVNNEFRSAGKYITEFNGSNMASGIYFARILVNEGKDFIAVRKMVLLK